MTTVVKTFSELTTEELYEIYKLRVDIFVVEQNNPCREIDEYDKLCTHVYMKDENGIQAYLRIIDKGLKYDEVSIGRVISVKRRCGLGTELLREGIRAAEEKYGAQSIILAAQVYAKHFYEKSGFVQISEEFIEDALPHIYMRYVRQ